MQHLVKKQVIDITCSKRTDAFRMQQLVSKHYWQQLVPLLDKIFDEVSDEEEVILVKQLEVDLGFITEEEMSEARWNDDIISRIRNQLYEKIKGKEKDKSTRHEAIRMSVCKQWLFYMQKGYLPWNVLHIDEGWYYQVLETFASDFTAIAELRKLIRQHPGVSRRIIEQHDEYFLIKLVEVLTAVSQRELAEMLEALAQLVFSHTILPILVQAKKKDELKRKIWNWVIELAASAQDKPGPLQLIEEVLLLNTSQGDISRIMSVADPSSFTIISPVVTKLHKKPELFSKDQLAVTKEKKKGEDKTETKTDTGIDEEGIFVSHAGVVLIHTFLTSVFKRLQLVRDSKFVDKMDQQKAIYILHYIASGKVIAEEHELVVPKVLCDWPVGMTVDKSVEITEDELNEADNMLQASIEQWPVLKNTSLAGLREAFLQRKGKLFTKNDKLHLQVEASSIDVLLDQLPWNLSMIKLPWMKAIFRVNWR